MSTELPKLRNDLLFSRQGREREATFVVKDPVNNQFFRLNEADHFIASQLDGRTAMETIRQRAEEKFEVSLSAQALELFVTNLRRSKLLESGSAEPPRGRRRRRLRGSLLYLRFEVFDPDALFKWLVGAVRFCFTPAFVAGSAALIVWAFALAIANWGFLREDLTRLLRWDALFWLLATACAVTTAHEFAHGLTCKHFGGEVRELGFLLLYFQPAFYCNVSDAWLFPEKSKRLWVGFAGPYFELFLWACAVLVWRLTDPETWINYVALAVLATSGIKTLLNFNPLLKLDGYYLLSDWLDMPNLRRRAYGFIGDGIKHLVRSRETAVPEIPRRDKRVYLAYGLVSAAFSFAAIGFLVVKLGGYLIDNRQPEVLLVTTGLLGLKVRRRFRSLFGRSPDSSELDEFSVADVPHQPNGAPEASKPARKPVPSSRPRLWFAAALVALVLPLLFFGRMQLRISGPFVVLPVRNADVRSEVGGTIEAVCVDEGDSVRAGDVIARLSDRDNRTALLKTEADIDQMQAQLRLLRSGPRPEEIELARIAVARAEDRQKFAKKNLERDRQLLQEHLISQKDFEASEQAVVDGASDIAEARKRLELLLAGSRPEEIEGIQAGIARLEIQRQFLEWQLAQVKVTSPASGIVVTPSRELKEMVGQVVKEGDLIAKVHEMKAVEVETPVSERDIADIKVGDKVALKARAFPEKTFFGVVTSVGTTAQVGQTAAAASASMAGNSSASPAGRSSSSSAPTVLVTTRIANDDLLLKTGMTGMVKIDCGGRRLFDLLARRVAHTVKVEFWSWW